MMYLPYMKMLKDHYSKIFLGNLSTPIPVNCRIKNPQKGFADLLYPGIGIEYVTSVTSRDRIEADRRVSDAVEGVAFPSKIVRKALEPMNMMFYIHTFTQDSQSMDAELQQAMFESTPYYFALNVELADGTHNCEIYREDIQPVVIEGEDREIHSVWQLKVWGWLDPDPRGTLTKLATSISSRYNVGMTNTEIDEEILSLI